MKYMEHFIMKVNAMIKLKYNDEEFQVLVHSDIFNRNLFVKRFWENLDPALYPVYLLFIGYIVHMRSLFLALISITPIFTSVPIAVMITEAWIELPEYNQLQGMVMVLVAILNTNCVFVFYDTWRQS